LFDAVDTLLLCSGKVAWELRAERAKREGDRPTTAIAAIERLYPRPIEELRAELERYPNLRRLRWVQDEPANMGAWPHLALHLPAELDVEIVPVSRPESSAPSVGQASLHSEQQKALVDEAFS